MALVPHATRRASFAEGLKLRASPRHYHHYVRYPTSQGRTIRLPLTGDKIIGVAVSRGNRNFQEDAHAISAIHLPWEELQYGLKRNFGISWNPGIGDLDMGTRCCMLVSMMGAHGGQVVSQYLRDHLHDRFETVETSLVPNVVGWLKESGGYFKRFRGGVLEEWTRDPPSRRSLDLEARATLAFLQACIFVLYLHFPRLQRCGATASVAILHPLELPVTPFFASEYQALTIAHCGDTRVILCSTESGKAFPMTENHHAETRGEAARLRRMGTGLVTDSYGEARWMGAVANTRGLGDSEFKPVGVTPEPEVRRHILKGKDWAFLAFVSDGVSSILSDDEIVDLARDSHDPHSAAQTILAFAEELGSEDNATVIIVPLSGWGTVRGMDRTKELRDYRKKLAVGSERQRRM
ncbi:hypothetical protein BS47DRAFT_1430712 [Hydnum rufescens UP504]|uniref:PPM-type phosphatase domain-containing protein n=1 Tax=Hydnum rufescens UP504 TaxID=1448309 RepID=A0A9P6B584_9AGAM|nr:hypothetical protein BS47DRAFT_1430712 [Hydnum rufescens UP504]